MGCPSLPQASAGMLPGRPHAPSGNMAAQRLAMPPQGVGCSPCPVYPFGLNQLLESRALG